MKQIGLKDYQSIKTPEELEEEMEEENLYESLLAEYDPDEGDYKAYKNWCRRRASEIMKQEENIGCEE